MCWAVKGGVGTTTVAAGIASAVARQGGKALLLDAGGDLPAVFGMPEPQGPGLAEWLRAGGDVPDDALIRIAVEASPGVDLITRGTGELHGDVGRLVSLLRADRRQVVADAGSAGPGAVAARLVAAADRSLLVTRACPTALRRLARLPQRPDGVVVVRDLGRSGALASIGARAGAPVVAELDVDPAVGRAIDAGLVRRALPKGYLAALSGQA